MSDTSSSENGCVGIFVALLTVAFIVLKLTDVIAWSWVWVLSPLWIFAILWVVIAVVLLGVFAWVYNKYM